MLVDTLDIVAIILGIFFTIRKLDAQHRTPKEFPHVDPEVFTEWQAQEVGVYAAGMLACFGKIVIDLAFGFFYVRGLSGDPYHDPLARAVGMTVDLSWLLVTLVTFYRATRMSKRRAELRIVLGGFIMDSDAELSSELKAALRTLEEGETDRALYELKQITLDADDSLKGIALYFMGEAYTRKGDLSAARDAFVESLEVDPSLQQPRDALAKLERGATERTLKGTPP